MASLTASSKTFVGASARAVSKRSTCVRVSSTSEKTASIKSFVSSNKVAVYSKTYCPYCTHVKKLLTSLKADPQVVELDTMGREGDALQKALQGLTGRRTVPQVFVGGKFIGGCDGTVALHSAGKLLPLLKEAGLDV